MAWLKETKPAAVEEFLDFYFYRRVAHYLVPLCTSLRMTPDQVTTLSLLTGLSAAYLVLHRQFIISAILVIGAIILDCTDGQLARITGKTSPMGRIMDGFFDSLWVTALWLAIFFSGYFQGRGISPGTFWLMFFASLSMFLHCYRFDGIKIKYLELAEPGFWEKDLDYEQATTLLRDELKRIHLFRALLALIIVFHVYFFVRGKMEKLNVEISEAGRGIAKERLEPIMRRWTWLGEGHHNTLVILGLLAAPWTPYGLIAAFVTILLPMNLWYALCLMRWRDATKQLKGAGISLT